MVKMAERGADEEKIIHTPLKCNIQLYWAMVGWSFSLMMVIKLGRMPRKSVLLNMNTLLTGQFKLLRKICCD